MSNRPMPTIRELNDAANRARVLRYHQEALALYRSLIHLEPNEGSYHHHAGELAAKLGDRLGAVEHFYDAALRYARLGFLARGIASLRLAAELGPVPHEVQELLGDLLTIKANGPALSDVAADLASKSGSYATLPHGEPRVACVEPSQWMDEAPCPLAARGDVGPTNPPLGRAPREQTMQQQLQQSNPPAPQAELEVTLPRRQPMWRAQAERLMGTLPVAAFARAFPKAPGSALVEILPTNPRSGRVNPYKD